MTSSAHKFVPSQEKFPSEVHLEVRLQGRDRLTLDLKLVSPERVVHLANTAPPGAEIVSAHLTGSGCPELLKLLQETRPRLKGVLSDIALPVGAGHAAMMMRELLLRARGQWQPPYQDEELCHCRAVATAKVDQAIISGCHDIQSIARQTSAGTSCGTCRPQSEALIAYRLCPK